MYQEIVRIWAGDASEAGFYRRVHLMASMLWDRGSAEQALTAWGRLLSETTPARPRTDPDPCLPEPTTRGDPSQER
jgi:hypothetical protein